MDRIKLNYKSFVRNLIKLEGENAEYRKSILAKSAGIFAAAAQKFTPPDFGKKSIPAKYYRTPKPVASVEHRPETDRGTRPIIDLLRYIRSNESRNRVVYGQMLRQGFKYAVLSKRKGKRGKRHFCRTFDEALRYATITYRGLFRASWGLDPSGVGEQRTAAIRSIVSKRPDIGRLSDKNSFRISRTGTLAPSFKMTISNRMVDGESFAKIAARKGEEAAIRNIDIVLKKYFAKQKKVKI